MPFLDLLILILPAHIVTSWKKQNTSFVRNYGLLKKLHMFILFKVGDCISICEYFDFFLS